MLMHKSSLIRFLFRFIGLLFLALGFIMLVHDGTKSIADQRWFITKLSDIWITFHEPSLTALRPMLESISSVLWDPVAVSVLSSPAWGVFLVSGALLLVMGRKPKPLIGYAR